MKDGQNPSSVPQVNINAGHTSINNHTSGHNNTPTAEPGGDIQDLTDLEVKGWLAHKTFPCNVRYKGKIYPVTCACRMRVLVVLLHYRLGLFSDLKPTGRDSPFAKYAKFYQDHLKK